MQAKSTKLFLLVVEFSYLSHGEKMMFFLFVLKRGSSHRYYQRICVRLVNRKWSVVVVLSSSSSVSHIRIWLTLYDHAHVISRIRSIS